MAYQDLEQASGRLMVIDPAGGTTRSDPQGNYRSQGSEAAAEKAALRGSLLSIVTIPPTAGPSPPSPSKRINVEQATWAKASRFGTKWTRAALDDGMPPRAFD